MSEKPVWPPRKEDLERLYIFERLSASKIAEHYGLRYASPKTAESTVLYHLKRKGITRRGKTDHIRKVTEAMVDDWATRYQAGESLKDIAGETVGPTTVFTHLKERGLVLRDKLEAQIKATTRHRRTPFDGGDDEKWYLVGLRYGDLHAMRHGRATRVRVSTTHPAMADLFDSCFSRYGHVARYPRKAKLIGFEWTLECDLDSSFDFLLERVDIEILKKAPDSYFLSFLAGLFDAEGSLSLHRKVARHNPEAKITNADPDLIDLLEDRLTRLGFFARVRWQDQRLDRNGIEGPSRIATLTVWRFREVQRLIGLLRLRHQEKVQKALIIVRMEDWIHDSQQANLLAEWNYLLLQIREQRNEFVASAQRAVEFPKG